MSINDLKQKTHMNKALSVAIYRYSRIIAITSSIGVAALLSACSTVQTPSSSVMQATEARHYQQDVQLSGRIHVLYQKNAKEQSLPGGFEWKQSKDLTHITLLSQFGQTLANIDQTPTGASLQQANEPLRTASDLDGLLNETLGWSLPVADLRNWLQGYQRQANGGLEPLPPTDNFTTEMNGWKIRYVSWQEDGGQMHPKRLDLTRYTTQAGEISMRIVIDQWQTP
jgi:outer membrane lipoprotein LolB